MPNQCRNAYDDLRQEREHRHGRSPSRPLRAYLDTNLVSALAKRDIPQSEVDALLELVELMHRGRLALVTSSVTEEEIDRVPEEHRAPHQGIYALLKKIPVVAEAVARPRIVQALRPGVPRIITPATMEHADLNRLRQILPDSNDARHIFHALENGMTYFVTADRKTILRYAREIESKFPIRIVSPSQLVAELASANGMEQFAQTIG